MHRAMREGDQLVQLFMLILSINGILEELINRLVKVYMFLSVNRLPDGN